jgi:hypothetical protein
MQIERYDACGLHEHVHKGYELVHLHSNCLDGIVQSAWRKCRHHLCTKAFGLVQFLHVQHEHVHNGHTFRKYMTPQGRKHVRQGFILLWRSSCWSTSAVTAATSIFDASTCASQCMKAAMCENKIVVICLSIDTAWCRPQCASQCMKAAMCI